jgi:hypothetical protein
MDTAVPVIRVNSLFKLFETLSYVETDEMDAFDMGWNGLRQPEIFEKDGSALRSVEVGVIYWRGSQ